MDRLPELPDATLAAWENAWNAWESLRPAYGALCPAVLAAYLLAANLASFLTFGDDKRRAKRRGARRVPERTLFLLALLGGSAGACCAMRYYHHKTRHWYFRFGMPLIFFAQLALAVWLFTAP